ncbi:hypothetical protein OAU50_02185 [Planctomycetota bacterium]|nr:hypothetical protein [Planctomycetota bacterium]
MNKSPLPKPRKPEAMSHSHPEDIAAIIADAARRMNLCTGRQVYSSVLAFVAGNDPERHEINLPTQPETCGFIIRLANAPTPDGDDAKTAYFNIGSELEVADSKTQLLAKGGSFIEAGAGASHVFSKDWQTAKLDFVVLDKDQATAVDGSLSVIAYELIPLKAKDCR